MKLLWPFVLAAMTLSACSSINTRSTDDLSLEQRLQHTWSYRESSPDVMVEGETTYLPDGVMNLHGHYRYKETTGAIIGSGTWHVKNGYLYFTVTKSNVARMIPNGFTSADKLVSVDDKELKFVDSATGRIVTERRIR